MEWVSGEKKKKRNAYKETTYIVKCKICAPIVVTKIIIIIPQWISK